MATNGVSPTINGPFRDTQYQSTGQLSREDGTTARNSWNDECNPGDARQNGQQPEPQHPAPKPIGNRKNNDSTNRNLAGTDDNINLNEDHHNNNNNQAQTQTEEDAAAHQPWFRRVAEKYGTLELENKGSVARDHLALGISTPYTTKGNPITDRYRTHIPRLAPNIPLIRLHRHRSNTVIPSQ